MQVVRAAGIFAVPEGAPNQYREHLRTPDLSMGTYCIPVGGKDGQGLHTEAETYLVQRGRARLVGEFDEVVVGPGSVIHIEAGEHHRFVDVTEDLSVIVVFTPPEGTGP
ncbi:MAG: cupin domain-containing protein [Pseudonocardia sp.]|nr:cupin domain-containing protein [Pseudonocardia sp.]